MNNVKRLHDRPYPTPRTQGGEMKMEPIGLGIRTKVALVGLGAITAVASVAYAVNSAFSSADDVPVKAPPATHDYGENPSGVPNSEGR